MVSQHGYSLTLHGSLPPSPGPRGRKQDPDQHRIPCHLETKKPPKLKSEENILKIIPIWARFNNYIWPVLSIYTFKIYSEEE